MTEISHQNTTETIQIDVFPQDNGQFRCQLSTASGSNMECHGQNRDHAIAIALERLAAEHRRQAEAQQNIDSLEVNRSPEGETVDREYHILLHYETIMPGESKFEATHNTLLGNTVVENATVTAIVIDPDLPVEPLQRYDWDED